MYNNNVRYNNCSAGTAPVGCGAVAMGQIMKYHNHPNMFNITTMYPYITTGVTYNYNTQPAYDIADFLGHIANNVNSYFYWTVPEGHIQMWYRLLAHTTITPQATLFL